MSRRMDIAKAYEKALFAADRVAVGKMFHDDIAYWVAGVPPIGGEWRGRGRGVDAVWDREAGPGAAGWGDEGGGRGWVDARQRAVGGNPGGRRPQGGSAD